MLFSEFQNPLTDGVLLANNRGFYTLLECMRVFDAFPIVMIHSVKLNATRYHSKLWTSHEMANLRAIKGSLKERKLQKNANPLQKTA